MNKVPFVDLYAQYLTIKNDIDDAIASTIKSSSYIGGDAVKKFENAFAEYLGIDHVMSCANGTDSLEILLQSFGIGKGDEVIVPAHSWISTSESVTAVGASPVFVDTEEDYFTIDAALIEKAITSKTKAIIPVHIYGHPADMEAIMQIADKYKLVVIEDCAQAHGATINGKKIGTIGHASSFSFYPGKNLGAYGDAGAMATNNAAIAEKARMIANHGQKGKHNHIIEGRNSRLDGLQAAILSVKLKHLQKWTEQRIANASSYSSLLNAVNVDLPKTKDNYAHVFHLYVIKHDNRDALQQKLKDAGIETAIHYPVALPFLPCYSESNYKPTDFPVSYKNQSRILSIPMFAELTKEQMTYVAEQIAASL
ncbi:DegT/DnrJ/EryC1/StrS family aminotransferase [Ferruginibacter sp. SUN002]|uniref:DegT/DnrJ/EryC1/StrS family aminotransferase n=1 Tax=Ferruginibacter sp. SUN002 TaxID=2937789 RepID=UPI003D361B0A